ncbi:MAG: acetyl-CoA hydrolase/transferase C-terminal domain-containing protein [bacterium]
MTQAATNWREQVQGRLVSPEEAVAVIENGDVVWGGGWTSVPPQLCGALAARGGQLKDVTIVSFLTPYKWDTPENLANFTIKTAYASPLDRGAVREGRMEYIPVAQFRRGHMPPGIDRFDVAMIPISPPDEEGWCSFGGGVFFSPSVITIATTLIGEVHHDFIRTGGDNRIHISKFSRVIEYNLPPAVAPIPPRSEETEVAAQVICTLVANEIVYDGCTLQFGIGDVSAALPAFLEERHNLGVHTELLPGGIPDLVEKGVITGLNKPHHIGKIVASAVGQVPAEDLRRIDGDPLYELYDFTHTDDLRMLLQIENFVAVNNAMAVDLTGNVSSETQGPNLFSGPGGQTSFAVASSAAAGGSVIVLPSSSLVNGVRNTRIVGGHPPGTVQTVHRGFVDFVVTEQGIARLRGKSIRERITELISVAHPDFTAELKQEASRLYGISL